MGILVPDPTLYPGPDVYPGMPWPLVPVEPQPTSHGLSSRIGRDHTALLEVATLRLDAPAPSIQIREKPSAPPRREPAPALPRREPAPVEAEPERVSDTVFMDTALVIVRNFTVSAPAVRVGLRASPPRVSVNSPIQTEVRRQAEDMMAVALLLS